MKIAARQNFFQTLNAALESEGLLEAWDSSSMSPIRYSTTRRWTWDDGSKHGHFISISRCNDGMYERPVHYAR